MDNGASSYRRFLDGDESGIVEIIRDYKDGLILYLNSLTGSISISEQLAEDTFVKLGIKKLKDNGKASFKTWLYIIGRNIAIDYLRKNKHSSVPIDEIQELADERDLELSYITKERDIIIHRAIQNLKAEYRQILWLIYFEGFSNKQAAAIMKKSVHNIEVLVSRARAALKKELEKDGFNYENL